MKTMTSRERVQRAVNFQPVDRVPIDLGGMKASGIGVKAYNRVKAQLGLRTPSRIWDPKFMIACVEEAMMQRFHLDVMPLDTSSVLDDLRPDSDWQPKTLYDGAEGLLAPGTAIGTDPEGRWALLDSKKNLTSLRMPREGYYFDDVAFNEPGATIDPAAFRPVTGFTDAHLRALQARGKFLYENTDYALLGWGGGVCFLGLSLITDRLSNVTMGLPSEWMVMLMTEKDTCHDMMDKSVDASIQCLKQLRDAVGDYCFAWGIAADDSGTQRGEFINPELWVEMIKPHYAKLCDWIHRNTPWKTFLHSCGSIHELIPHMIEAGVDILNPIQTSAGKMSNLVELKKLYGDKLTFCGAVDTHRILPFGTPEEVAAEVKRVAEILSPGGGYMLSSVHTIMNDVPASNILAMVDAITG